jgi:hypothetical protein
MYIYIYMDFFIWNIKTLIFFNFSGLTRVDSWIPGLGPLAESILEPGLITKEVRGQILTEGFM